MHATLRNAIIACATGFATLATVESGMAAMTLDQARAKCRERFTEPVRACVRQRIMQRGGSVNNHLEPCKATVAAPFRTCITNLMIPGASGFRQSIIDQKAPAQTARMAARQQRSTPPRTIADITAILDQEKPDPARIKKLQEAADAALPAGSDPLKIAHFYNERGNVRAQLGRFRDAIADGEKAIQLSSGKSSTLVVSTFRVFTATQHIVIGEPKKAAEYFSKIIEESERAGQKGFLFLAYRNLVGLELLMGNLDRAQAYQKKNEDLLKEAKGIMGFQHNSSNWEGDVEEGKGRLLEARGDLVNALKAFERGEALRRKAIVQRQGSVVVVPRAVMEQVADNFLMNVARVKSRLGRVVEAETDARRALLSRLQATGKYAPATARYIGGLGMLLVEQGRYDDARKLIAATIDIYREVGVAEDSQSFVQALGNLGMVLALQGQWEEAAKTYAAMEQATRSWEPMRRGMLLNNHSRIHTLYRSGRVENGMAAVRRLLEFRVARYGDQHSDTALARGLHAVGLVLSGKDAEALKDFEASVPILTGTTFNTDNDDALGAAARTRYTQIIVERYIELLGRTRAGDAQIATETFRLADVIRGRAVQKALSASGARMSASDPKLAEVVREEQDLGRQVGVQLGQLNVLLALPAAERDEAGIAAMRREIDRIRARHATVRADIERRFPEYVELIDPKPPTSDQIRQMLRPGEALLSFYFGREASFVWAVSHDGKVEFAPLPQSAEAIDAKITKLRDALEPQAAMISDIPPFDLALSHELYKTLLEPVKGGWQNANSLIVITNGALGLLPLSLLTVAPHQLSEDGPTFHGYRAAPWLARTHAVTLVPSASALRMLRRLPPASDKREKLIGFGDPFFNDKHAAEGEQATTQLASASAVQTRGIPLRRRAGPQTQGADSADLGQLPRLPDTADELRSVAIALEADPSKALHLGKAANEQSVKKANLSGFKIVAFATHGLVPGEIDGLTQPALALSAPSVAGVDGDGLLTMDEILTLKLDADWVVLSACNTGAGAGAGAEAASGLGRAFFYAGTRAILVTNWSVHSQSARELVTDLFARQAADARLARGEALRQAMIAMLDGKGFTDEKGETVFAYAHPLFWAPYTIIGDGG